MCRFLDRTLWSVVFWGGGRARLHERAKGHASIRGVYRGGEGGFGAVTPQEFGSATEAVVFGPQAPWVVNPAIST